MLGDAQELPGHAMKSPFEGQTLSIITFDVIILYLLSFDSSSILPFVAVPPMPVQHNDVAAAKGLQPPSPKACG